MATISEESSSESQDSAAEQDRVRRKSLRTSARLVQGDEGRRERRTKAEIQNVYDRFAFGNLYPSLAKNNTSPWFEDFADKRGNNQDAFNKSKTYQSKTMHALKQKADELSIESTSQRPTSSILL